jgi:thymidylate synthase
MQCNDEYQKMITNIHNHGEKQVCRNFETYELLSNFSSIPMEQPLITLAGRKLGYKFACAEAAWMLSADNRVISIAPYSKMIARFSDDGTFFFGAYGPKIMDQIEYIGRCFKADLGSRQAVLNIWREKPPVSKDIPCTLNLQFLIRVKDNVPYLHVIDNMRSSDAWLGVPYDWFSLSMVGAYVAIYIRNLLKIDLQLGYLHMHAGSQHLYHGGSFGYKLEDAINLIGNNNIAFEYEPLDISEFDNPELFVAHLSMLASTGSGYHFIDKQIKWLFELSQYWGAKK